MMTETNDCPKPRSEQLELLHRAREGCEDSLGKLLMSFGRQSSIKISIPSKFHSILDVADIMQITYFEAALHFERFKGPLSGLRAWISRIAENNLNDAIAGLSALKRPQPHDQLQAPRGQDSKDWIQNLVTSDDTSPSSHYNRREHLLRIQGLLPELPEDYARVIRLLYFEARSEQEVADIMERSLGAVCLLSRRAIERLRDIGGYRGTNLK